MPGEGAENKEMRSRAERAAAETDTTPAMTRLRRAGGTKTVILTVGLSALAALLFPLKDEAGTPEAPEAREKEAEA